MKYLISHNKRYLPLIIATIMILALQAYTNLMLPNVMSEIVNVGIQDYTRQIAASSGRRAETLKAEQQKYIISTGVKMLGLAVVVSAAGLGSQFCSARWGAGLSRDLRKTVFTKVESFSGAEFDRFSTASLITRTTNDIQQVQMMCTMGMRMMFFAPITGFGAIIMAYKKAPNMVWVCVLAVCLVICLMGTVYSITSPKFELIQKLVDRLNLVARESLSGMMVVRAFSTEKDEEARFESANREYKKVNLFVNRVMSFMGPTMTFFNVMIPVLIVWVGAGWIAQSKLLVGDMMAFIQYIGNIMQSFMMMSSMFIMLPRAMISLNRVSQVLDTENEIIEKENPTQICGPRCEIVFDDVTFSYPSSDGNAIENISFTAKPGEITAIIGSTGCGKTSLVNLIPRLYDVTEGSVKINGTDVRDASFENLRGLIGYVPQKSSLLSGTIRTNLLSARPDRTEEDMLKAIKIAQAEEFVMSKPRGLDFEVSRGGSNFSGGQRQRLCIARAVVKAAPIYIFDDSFSALDFTTDLNLRKALKENLKDSAIILIGQRVSSIMDCEQIIVMDEGKIVGKGTHSELMKTCKPYQEIANSQLTQEEVG